MVLPTAWAASVWNRTRKEESEPVEAAALSLWAFSLCPISEMGYNMNKKP